MVEKAEPSFADERFPQKLNPLMRIPTVQVCDATMLPQRTNAGTKNNAVRVKQSPEKQVTEGKFRN